MGSMEHRAHILVVDDEPAITHLVAHLLSTEGFEVDCCQNGLEALEALHAATYDLVVLDIMMPGIDGFETCRRMRVFSDAPIVFLTAKDGEFDSVLGLSLGADDYIAKPFRTHEFVARIKARLRRASHREEIEGSHEALGIALNEKQHVVSLHDVPLMLTPKEFDLLALLMEHQGTPVSTRELFERIWHERFDASASNAVMVHIRHLRGKLAAVDSSRDFIVNVWGVGYKIPLS